MNGRGLLVFALMLAALSVFGACRGGSAGGGNPSGSGSSSGVISQGGGDGGSDASSPMTEEDSGGTPTGSSSSGGAVSASDGGSDGVSPGVPEASTDSGDGGASLDAALNADVLAVMSRVADYGITQYGDAGCDWANAAFFPGLLAAYDATGTTAFREASTTWAENSNWLVCTANPSGPTFADNQCCTQTYSELYLLDESPANSVMIANAKGVFDAMIATPVAGQTLWNWADALFMAPPAIALMGTATGDDKYFTYLDTTYWEAAGQLFDSTTGLFWRNPPSASETSFWSRGNGWVIAGTARILDYLPANDSTRAAFVTQLQTMAAAIAPLQNQTDGLWRSNLLDAAEYPNPETSGSGFFVYAMAWGVARNILDSATYLPVVRKGWDGLVGAVNAEGALGWVQGVGTAPGPATATSTAPYAAGAFLLAGSEVAKVY